MNQIGKYLLLAIQFAGLILSGLIVFITFASPEQVEERLQNFAIAKVEEAANEAWDAADRLAEGSRTERFGALAERFGLNAEQIDIDRKKVVPALLAKALSDRCTENCDFWIVAGAAVNSTMLERVAKLRVGQGTLQDFVVDRYETSVRGLIVDLRRFGMVNVLAFVLMIGLVVFRQHLNWRFTAFSVALTGYTAWASYGYFYKQNWALSILLQDWAAPGYQAAMIFVCCLLFDWLFLNGRITDAVVSTIVNALPS